MGVKNKEWYVFWEGTDSDFEYKHVAAQNPEKAAQKVHTAEASPYRSNPGTEIYYVVPYESTFVVTVQAKLAYEISAQSLSNFYRSEAEEEEDG